MKAELGPRLVNHHERQVEYYEKQLEDAIRSLARVALLYNGQLTLFEGQEDSE